MKFKSILTLTFIHLFVACNKSEFSAKSALSNGDASEAPNSSNRIYIPDSKGPTGSPESEDSSEIVENENESSETSEESPVVAEVVENENSAESVGQGGSQPNGNTVQETVQAETSSQESGSGYDLDNCRINIGATSVGKNVKITVFAGVFSQNLITGREEFQSLSSQQQRFIIDAISGDHSSFTVASKKSATLQAESETLKVKNSEDARVSFNQIETNTDLRYLIDGKNASFSATGLRRGAKIVTILTGEKIDFKITKIHDDAELFIIVPGGENLVSCVQFTSIKDLVKLSVTVNGQVGHKVQSSFRFTGIETQGLIDYRVSGGDHTKAILKATKISNANVTYDVKGLLDTEAAIEFTSVELNNMFKVKLRGTDDASFRMTGTSAGLGTYVGLDVLADADAQAYLKFTDPSDLKIEGKMLGTNLPQLITVGRVAQSTGVQITRGLKP